jgi:hypothetical protein
MYADRKSSVTMDAGPHAIGGAELRYPGRPDCMKQRMSPSDDWHPTMVDVDEVTISLLQRRTIEGKADVISLDGLVWIGS